MSNLRVVPIKSVRPNEIALRGVDRESEKFLAMVDSVRAKGILNPILVRDLKDQETGASFLGVVDGLHRFTAAVEAGLDAIPVNIVEAGEAETLELQIIGNLHRVETKPVEYSKQLQRLLAYHPTMTLSELGAKVSQSSAWVSERLGLLKLTENIGALVNDGKINITNAYALAKLPAEEQGEFVDRAMVMAPSQFLATVNARVKELRDSKKQGKGPNSVSEFSPVAFLQKSGDLKAALENPASLLTLLKEFEVTTVEEAVKMTLQWVWHLDPASVEVQRQKDKQRREAAAAAKEARRAEAERKAQSEAVTVAAAL